MVNVFQVVQFTFQNQLLQEKQSTFKIQVQQQLYQFVTKSSNFQAHTKTKFQSFSRGNNILRKQKSETTPKSLITDHK